MRNCVETAWIMAEIEPYSFELMRDSLQSEEDMFTRVKMSAEEEIHCGVCASVVRTVVLRATRERMLMMQRNQGSS